MCSGAGCVEVAPSPKAQVWPVIVPSGSVDPEASNEQLRPAQPTPIAAVGATLTVGSAGAMVKASS